MIASAESIKGGSELVAQARQSIIDEQQVEIGEKYTGAVAAFDSGDYDLASSLIDELRGINYDEAALVSLEQQIEEERVILDFTGGHHTAGSDHTIGQRASDGDCSSAVSSRWGRRAGSEIVRTMKGLSWKSISDDRLRCHRPR